MVKRGVQRHLKRLSAPALWPIRRKENKWTVKPMPGPHRRDRCLPLVLIVRDLLKLVKTRREIKYLLSEGCIKIDGRVRRDAKYPVGLMDVIEAPTIKRAYRVLPSIKKRFALHEITRKEIGFKLCKIVNKTSVKGGHLQINLNDGRNILVRSSDPRNLKEDIYDTQDTLKIEIPNSDVSDNVKLKKGVIAIVTDGKNMGHWGKIVDIEKRSGLHSPIITLVTNEKDQVKTIMDYIFVIGKTRPWVSMLKEEEL
jgi:small subunit ribosomal protein S4e